MGFDVDRWLLASLTFSLCGHVLVLGTQLIALSRHEGRPYALKPAKLVYEALAAPERAKEREMVQRIQVRLSQLPEPPQEVALGALAGGTQGRGVLGIGASEYAPQVGFGRGSVPGGSPGEARGDGIWSSAIDLTNLTTAARGDSMLYSYLSTMREHIQRVANTHAWLSSGADGAGTVYVGFVVNRTGAVESVGVVAGRSVDSRTLQEAALHIIQASSPFVPFPPSFEGSSKSIVVPIEFSFGSS